MNTDEQGYEGSKLRDEQIKTKKEIINAIRNFEQRTELAKYTVEYHRGISFACKTIIEILEKKL